MRYLDFIDELCQLQRHAIELREANVTHEDDRFRSWRHRTESLIQKVVKEGYELPGTVRSSDRYYMDIHGDPVRSAERMTRDLRDTEIELQFIIDDYRKYGQADRSRAVSSQPQPVDQLSLELPEKITFYWLFTHVPVTFWGAGVALLLGAFLAGVRAGRTEAYKTIASWLSQVFGGG